MSGPVKYEVLAGIIILLALLALSACTTPFKDGYQFGDATASVFMSVRGYCMASTPLERQMALRIINASAPGYPTDNICERYGFETTLPGEDDL